MDFGGLKTHKSIPDQFIWDQLVFTTPIPPILL